MTDEVQSDLNINRILEETNIAKLLDKDELLAIGRLVVEEYDEDETSREEWITNTEQYNRLAMQVVEEKSFPWKGASNVKYPLMTTAAVQFSARAYPSLLPGKQVVKAAVTGKDPDGSKRRGAQRVEGHMSYQVLNEMRQWEEDMDRLTLILPLVGCIFKKTYRDTVDEVNVSELVLGKDLCVDYYAKSIDTAERATHILELTNNDIYERVMAGIYEKVELGTHNKDKVNARRSNLDTIQGTKPPAKYISKAPRIVLEQHRFLDLDGDGYEEPYIVTVDYDTKQVFRIVARFDKEGVRLNDQDEVIRITPVNHFTKFGFIPNPDGGFYDVGFGLLLNSINLTINTLINQLIDAGTLSNMQSGFISKGIRIRKGQKHFTPGEWKDVHTSLDDIRKGLVPLPVREPSQVLYLLLGTLLESGERLASTVDILMGQNPGQNQPATTTLAVIEQGLTVFTAIYKRIHRSLGEEFKKLYRLNRIYLEESAYYDVLDDDRAESQQVFASDYNIDNTNIQPFSDPNISSDAIIQARANALLELMPLGLNPDEVKRRILEAQKQPNIDKLLELPPQEPPFEQKLEEARHKHQVEYDHAMLKIETMKAESSATKDEAKALLDTAKAIATEMQDMRDNVMTALALLTEKATTVEGEDDESARAAETTGAGEGGAGTEV